MDMDWGFFHNSLPFIVYPAQKTCSNQPLLVFWSKTVHQPGQTGV